MERILVVDSDNPGHKQQAAEWSRYGVGNLRFDNMHEAIAQLKNMDEYLFIAINEDNVLDFMILLPIMRDITDNPIFVITSDYTIEKKVKAISLGADAYDPFNLSSEKNVHNALELLIAHRKRTKRPTKAPQLLIGGDIILSQARRKVFVNDYEISLAKKEFDILRYLMENRGYVVEHKQLLQEIWGENYNEKDTDVLWRTVNRLRAKLSEGEPTGDHIKIERGVGYIFRA
jgi:DNA-binding response OmpR family regulator